jgi:hypothetical protein
MDLSTELSSAPTIEALAPVALNPLGVIGEDRGCDICVSVRKSKRIKMLAVIMIWKKDLERVMKKLLFSGT